MPRNITVTFADGTSHVYQNAPDAVTPDEVQSRAEKQFAKTVKGIDGGAKAAPEETSVLQDIKQGAGNLVKGLASGAADIGDTILKGAAAAAKNPAISMPLALIDTVTGGAITKGDKERSQGLKSFNDENKDSTAFGVGRVAANIAGTAGVGGMMGTAAKGLGASPAVVEALTSSGMSAAGMNGVKGMALRSAAGAATGGASAALVNPDDAAMGAVVGGAAPPVLKAVGAVAGKAGQAVRSAVGGKVGTEVADLAKRAKELGVDIPADRLVNSRPMNAVASALNYVPFSGRAATEDLMNSQLNRAVSRTFGQDSPNVTAALRKAQDTLGAEFDHTLRNNGVKVDKAFLDGITEVYNKAQKELGADALKPIAAQIDELVAKGGAGVIDGQAAYNIKRSLDRLGRQNTPTSFHALELKGQLMDALDRSLGPMQSTKFAKVREQYGNMLALEKLAKNGAEGEISVARLANMQNINNKPLQEIADIAAQFVKPREGAHGAAQRAAAGAITLGMGGVPALATGAAIGRTANAALNSTRLKALMLGEKIEPSKLGKLLAKPGTQEALVKSAPILAADDR